MRWLVDIWICRWEAHTAGGHCGGGHRIWAVPDASEGHCGRHRTWSHLGSWKPRQLVVGGWCYAIGDQDIPGMSEWMLPVAKEAEVSRRCLWEGAMDLDGVGGTKVTSRVGDGSQVVNWVWIIKAGPDSLVVHDGQVVGQWEVVENAGRYSGDNGKGQKLEGQNLGNRR